MWRTFVASQTTGRLSILDQGVLQLRDRLPYISIYERPRQRRLRVSIAGGSVSADPQFAFRISVRVYCHGRESRRGRGTGRSECRDAPLLRAAGTIADAGSHAKRAPPLRRGDGALPWCDQGGTGRRLHAGGDRRVPARGTPLDRAVGG